MHLGRWKLIEEYAKDQMIKLGLHGWPHVKRVERLCKLISRFEKERVDWDALKAAALLHDIAKHVEKENPVKNHEDVGAMMAQDILKTVGFDETKIKLVCQAIKVHTYREEQLSIEAKILHDADFLDKQGAVGVATIFIKACLTDTTIEEVAEIHDTEISKSPFVAMHIRWLKKQHYYTKTAKKIAKRRKRIVSAFFKALKNELDLKGLT